MKFDAVDQTWLIRFLEHRIGDKRILRLIRKWLKVGVLEDGAVTVSELGTGQGSVISPILANVSLHCVIDLWAERWRRRPGFTFICGQARRGKFLLKRKSRGDRMRGRVWEGVSRQTGSSHRDLV